MTGETTLDSREIALPDPAATLDLGRRLGARLSPGDVVCLSGGLGAGKTTLSRIAIEAWTGQPEEAPSPTYTLVQTHEGARGQLWHVDLYRLDSPEEAEELGLEDALENGALDAKWPEKLDAWMRKRELAL